MISVPLPVKLSWYAYHYSASAIEAQMRMTHACWMAMMQAHPLAPHGLSEVKKAPVGGLPSTAKPRRTARPKPVQAKPARKAARARPAPKPAPAKAVAEPAAAPASKPAAPPEKPAKPAETAARAPVAGQKRKTRAPATPPPMPEGRKDG